MLSLFHPRSRVMQREKIVWSVVISVLSSLIRSVSPGYHWYSDTDHYQPLITRNNKHNWLTEDCYRPHTFTLTVRSWRYSQSVQLVYREVILKRHLWKRDNSEKATCLWLSLVINYFVSCSSLGINYLSIKLTKVCSTSFQSW